MFSKATTGCIFAQECFESFRYFLQCAETMNHEHIFHLQPIEYREEINPGIVNWVVTQKSDPANVSDVLFLWKRQQGNEKSYKFSKSHFRDVEMSCNRIATKMLGTKTIN